MTTKNRNKHSSSDKNSSSVQEETSKKPQRSINGGSGSVSQGLGSGSSLKFTLAMALLYIVLVAAGGFAAYFIQHILEEIHQLNAKYEDSSRENTNFNGKMESVLQQVESLRRVVDGLESSLGVTRAELGATTGRLKKGEVETRRLDEALQKLQDDLLRELSEGIREVKEARERDFSSLENTVEERLVELSGSIAASVAEFTEAQGEAQGQLADLKARLGEMEDPALLKQELSVIVDTVAELTTARQVSDASADLLREQIGGVSTELQTRNQEVASLSREVDAMRTLMQETVGSLRQTVTVVEASVQALTDKSLTLEGGVTQATEAVNSVEKEMQAYTAQAQQRSDELENRVKASEDAGKSMSELTSKVESLLAKYDAHESTLIAHGQAVEKARTSLTLELDALKSRLEEFELNMANWHDAQASLVSKDSTLGEQMEQLDKRLVNLEDSTKASIEAPEHLEKLKSVVANLESRSIKLEHHEQAISALQNALDQTTSSLAALAKKNNNK